MPPPEDRTEGERQLEPAESEAEGLQECLAELEEEAAALRHLLHRAESVRRTTVERVREFEADFEEALATCESQRAWGVMRWLRTAYALLFRQSRCEAIRFLAAAVMRRTRHLDDADVRFPKLTPYLPDVLDKTFLDGPLDDLPIERFPVIQRVAGIPVPRSYDVVILPVPDFEFHFRRPQQLASQFAAAGHRVFRISPSRHLSPALRAPYRLERLGDSVWEVVLHEDAWKPHQDTLDAGQVDALVKGVSQLYAECGIAENCAVVQMASWRPVALELRRRFGAVLLYDCMTDWGASPDGRLAGQAQEEQSLAQECDVLTITAARLAGRFSGTSRAPVLVRNAADADFFGAPAPERVLADVPRPVIGFFGVPAGRVDLELIRKLAESRPHYTVVCAGNPTGMDVSPLRALDNVVLPGPCSYDERPRYLREFDLCLIPCLVDEPTNATDPVELYEYLSQGKPVVATDMEELSSCADLIYIARDHAEFIEKVDLALRETDPSLVERRLAFARSNSWPARFQTMDEEIRKTFPPVSILIVTHNSLEFVRPCLDSVIGNTLWPNYEIIVVDNASTDGTRDALTGYAEACPRVRVFALDRNTGFAGGNNFAARQARGEYLILLNADTIVTRGWVERLVRPARRDSRVGTVVAVTNFAGNEVKINVEYRDRSEMESFARAIAQRHLGETLEVRVAPLYCALIPRRVWDEVGNLDESYTVGMFEDDDYSLRVRRAGYRILTAEDCFIHHFGQGAFRKLDPKEFEAIFESNRARFEKKWGEPWQPHRYREGIKPVEREPRFRPDEFARPAAQ